MPLLYTFSTHMSTLFLLKNKVYFAVAADYSQACDMLYIIAYAAIPDIIMILHFAVCLDTVPCYTLHSAMIIYCMST